jgi:uncharacterized protein (TIGR02231 family)
LIDIRRGSIVWEILFLRGIWMKIRKMSLVIVSVLVLGIYHTPLTFAERTAVKTDSKIEKVMVYQDRALVTRRTGSLTLKKGIFDIYIRNLPYSIKDDSVRAKITRGRNIRILDVEVKTYQLKTIPEVKIRTMRERLQQLEDSRKKIKNQMSILYMEMDYLKSAKKTFLNPSLPSERSSKNISIGRIDRIKVAELEKMLKYLNRKYQENLNSMHDEKIKLRDIDKKIQFIKGEMSKLNITHSAIPKKKMIKVTLEPSSAGSYVLDLSYINYRIKWEPSYDIRVLYSRKKTEFIGYGIVSQRSGEDWMNTKISYSTAQPALQGWLPELLPLYAVLSSRMQRGRRKSSYKGSFPTQQALNRSLLDNINMPREKKSGSGEGLMTQSAKLSKDTRHVGSMVFNVMKRSNIRSDGSPHRTAISRQTFPVKFEYICIPKLSPYAYLQAIGKNSLKVPILQGALNIFMENDFVGSSSAGNILPGEDFELTLSVNENIRVKRILDEKEEKEGGFLSNQKRIKYSFLINVENYTGQDIIMNILDQIPVSRTDKVKIEDISFSEQPVKREKNGIIKWQFKMKPEEKKKINFSFSINVPKGMEAAFFRTNLPPSLYLQNIQTKDQESELYKMNKSKGPAMRQKMY